MSATTILVRGALGAVLATAAVAAQAQVDYGVYGVADFSYGRFEPSGFEARHRFNSNSLTASFVGVNASYGFDGGWKPGITLETFVRFQDFDIGRTDADPILSRKAFVSLASNYGTLSVGRLQTLLFDTTTRFNAMGNSVAFSPAVRHIFASGNIEGVQEDFYWSRGAGYVSFYDTQNTGMHDLVLVTDQDSMTAKGKFSKGADGRWTYQAAAASDRILAGSHLKTPRLAQRLDQFLRAMRR